MKPIQTEFGNQYFTTVCSDLDCRKQLPLLHNRAMAPWEESHAAFQKLRGASIECDECGRETPIVGPFGLMLGRRTTQ
jgi:hypothetical protein